MNILGLYWGFGSATALLQDNQITRAVSEERFTRIKNEDVFPLKSLKYCLDGIEKIDGVAVASLDTSYWYHLKRKSRWTIEDYIREQYDCWYPKLIEGKEVEEKDFLKHRIDTDQYPTEFWQKSIRDPLAPEKFAQDDRLRIIAETVGIENGKIRMIEHHRCHAYYAYYASSIKNEPVLAMTIDGWGDGCNATINIFNEKGECRRVFTTKDANIGRIYRYITLLLGMKPNEHEYKVMGLAPYCKESISQKAYEVFKSTLYVDGIDFKWNVKPSDSYFWFKEKLEGCRFDGIAAGMQRWTEELLCDWVKGAVKEFKIGNIVLSGGVAMNIKANGEIAKLPEVETFFVPGAPSDESLVLGAVYSMAEDLEKGSISGAWKSTNLSPLPQLYLGPKNDLASEEVAVAVAEEYGWRVLDEFTAADIAKLVAAGSIVARCAGRMEFGARALCNRSILADPLNISVIPRINAAIKNRDFWMPFAPVILDAWVEKYLENPKGLKSPFMTIGFETTPTGWHHLSAGCHQADKTARPQILTEDQNQAVYEIINEFAKLTGRGVLLNTSFNLHGYPIVNTAAEAMYVFKNSGLDALVLNNFLIRKEN